MALPRIVITAGEPAGVGPDILLKAALRPNQAQLVAVGCAEVLTARAAQLKLDIRLTPYTSTNSVTPHHAGVLPLINIPTKQGVCAGYSAYPWQTQDRAGGRPRQSPGF